MQLTEGWLVVLAGPVTLLNALKEEVSTRKCLLLNLIALVLGVSKETQHRLVS
jgi:hypothetical protein